MGRVVRRLGVAIASATILLALTLTAGPAHADTGARCHWGGDSYPDFSVLYIEQPDGDFIGYQCNNGEWTRLGGGGGGDEY